MNQIPKDVSFKEQLPLLSSWLIASSSTPIPGKTVFPALFRLSSRGSTHTTVPRGTALCESLLGKPRGKASRASHRSLDPREGKRDPAATAREESARACPHSRRSWEDVKLAITESGRKRFFNSYYYLLGCLLLQNWFSQKY